MDLEQTALAAVQGQQSNPAAAAPPPPAATSGATAPPPASPAPGTTPPPASVPASVAPAAPGAGTSAPQAWVGVKDYLGQLGYSVPQGVDSDHAALQHLIRQAQDGRQLQPYAEAGRTYMQHRQQFETWLAEQQKAQQAAQTQKANWFSAPEYDPSWRHQVYRDPQDGMLKALPNTPPGVVEKYLQAQQHQQGFLEKLAFDPIGTIKPGIEQVVQEVASRLVQQQLAQQQQESFTRQFLSENKWLYESGQDGQPVRDPLSGQARLSVWGQRFKQHVDTLMGQGLGAYGDQTVAQLAFQATDREFLLWKLQNGGGNPAAPAAPPAATAPATPQQQQATANQQFLANAQAQAARAVANQTQPAAIPAAPPTPAASQFNLAEVLRQRFQQGGVTDRDIQASLVALASQ